MMVSLLDKLKSAPVASPRTVDAPTDAATVGEVKALLSERQMALAQARGALDQLEAEISDVKVAKALGEPIDNTGLLALAERADTQRAVVRDEETVVAGLRDRLGAWDRLEGRRRFDAAVAELTAISARSAAQEREYERLSIELVDTAQAIAVDRERFTALQGIAGRLQDRHGFEAIRLRRPYELLVIPETYFGLPHPLGIGTDIRRFFSKTVRRGAMPTFGEDVRR